MQRAEPRATRRTAPVPMVSGDSAADGLTVASAFTNTRKRRWLPAPPTQSVTVFGWASERAAQWPRPSRSTSRASRVTVRTPTCCCPLLCHGAMPPEAEEDAALPNGSLLLRCACAQSFCWLCTLPALPGYPSSWVGGASRRGRTLARLSSVDQRLRCHLHHRHHRSMRCMVRPSPPSPSSSLCL